MNTYLTQWPTKNYQDALQAQMVLNRISEIIDSPPPVTNANQSSTLQRKLDNVSEDNPEFPDEENNISIVSL